MKKAQLTLKPHIEEMPAVSGHAFSFCSGKLPWLCWTMGTFLCATVQSGKPGEATLRPTLYASCSHSHVWQPYLQVIIEELPHALEAAAGQLVLLQPEQSAVHMILIDVNVRAGLSKGPGYKSCQPASRAQRNPVSQPGAEPARTIGLG